MAQFVSGDTFEDMIASLTWPCTLPPGVMGRNQDRLKAKDEEGL